MGDRFVEVLSDIAVVQEIVNLEPRLNFNLEFDVRAD